jgi:hypothetical protein
MGDECIELDKGIRIEQEIKTLARRKLAPTMLLRDSIFTTTKQRFDAHRLQLCDPFIIGRQRLSPLTVFAQGQVP